MEFAQSNRVPAQPNCRRPSQAPTGTLRRRHSSACIEGSFRVAEAQRASSSDHLSVCSNYCLLKHIPKPLSMAPVHHRSSTAKRCALAADLNNVLPLVSTVIALCAVLFELRRMLSLFCDLLEFLAMAGVLVSLQSK